MLSLSLGNNECRLQKFQEMNCELRNVKIPFFKKFFRPQTKLKLKQLRFLVFPRMHRHNSQLV